MSYELDDDREPKTQKFVIEAPGVAGHYNHINKEHVKRQAKFPRTVL
jgi:hypothetical protein